MITLRENRTSVWETNRSLCRDPYDSSQGFYSSQSPLIFQETECSDISEITEAVIVNAIKTIEQCAQDTMSVTEDERARINIPKSNTEVIEVEIHAEENDAQQMVHFEEAQDISDAGSSTPVEPHARHD